MLACISLNELKIKITRRTEQTALIGAEQIPAKRATKSDGVL